MKNDTTRSETRPIRFVTVANSYKVEIMTRTFKPVDFENLAVEFRCGYSSVCHVSNYDILDAAGLLYLFGVYRGTPQSYVRRRQELRNELAEALDNHAAQVREARQ